MDLLNQPQDPSGTGSASSADQGALSTEVMDNPVNSEYYTEPYVSYGAPGDGIASYDTSDTYLASVQYDPKVTQATKQATDMLLSKAGIVGTGTAVAKDGSKHVIVFAKDAVSASTVPTSINGVPTEVKVTGKVRALGYTGEYRPTVPAGVSVGNSRENSSGTIGAIVVKNGIRYILSNNHVLARENKAVIGEPIVQPGRADNYGQPTGQIGVLSAYKKVSFRTTNIFDAAVARLTTTNAYDEADQFAPSQNSEQAVAGMQVMKVGRTTGLTYGTIEATDVTVKVDYDGQTATFSNQIYIPGGNFLQAGDSGSLLVTADGAHPVGLCFAGGDDGAFANPIQPILSYFGVGIAGVNNGY